MNSLFSSLFGRRCNSDLQTGGHPVNLALLGPSGSGKGTHLTALKDTVEASTIGAGELLRTQLQNDTALGIRARKYMEAAEMVPDELVAGMIQDWIDTQDANRSLIFDGFPRTVHQARFLDHILRERGGFLDAAIYFHISDEEVIERLAGRLVCRSCNRSYHQSSNPPERKGKCDTCGETVERRPDDTPELIGKRLRVFHRQIGPVLSWYQRSGRLRTVAATAEVSVVSGQLAEIATATRVLAKYAPGPELLEHLGASVGKAPRHDPASFPSLDLVLLGGPGSGKGTQADLLCEKLGLPHISTGDLFRESLRNETELGKLAKTYMDRGELVPDDVTESMVEERLSMRDAEKGFVLDGFPRSLAQAEALTEMLDSMNRRLSAVINIEVSDEVIVDRLSGRLICRDCQNSFHLQFKPPKTQGQCDQCGGELYQRDDDNPETVQSRLSIFHTETGPLIRYYEEAKLIQNVDGESAPGDVHTEIMQKMRELG